MAIYCMSDIHGNYFLFKEMLEYIKFNKEDELYILGDIFDRGQNVYEIYEYVQTHDNVHVLLGNHEDMAMDAIKYKMSDWILWFHRNGGIETYQSFYRNFNKFKHKYIDKFNSENSVISRIEEFVQKEIMNFCSSLPLYKEIKVNNKEFILVHAGISSDIPIKNQSKNTLLWIRDLFIYNPVNFDNKIVVFGHTPTYSINNRKNCSIWVDEDNKDKIGIDGACYASIGNLNCLRLDDLVGFSINNETRKKEKYKINI